MNCSARYVIYCKSSLFSSTFHILLHVLVLWLKFPGSSLDSVKYMYVGSATGCINVCIAQLNSVCGSPRQKQNIIPLRSVEYIIEFKAMYH